MKKNRLKKLILAGTAILMAVVLSGCSIKFGTRKKNEPKSDAVVAHPTKGDAAEDMNITYETFRKEYQYILVNSGIEDDTLEEYAASCKAQRESVIKNLINEQIVLCKAKEMGVYDLTEEEQAEVEKEIAEVFAEMVKNFGDRAAQEQLNESDGGTSMTDEEKEEAGNRKLDEMLKKCGMTRDDLRWWAQSSKIMLKVQEAIGSTVDYSKAEEGFKEIRDYAEELYNSDVSQFMMTGYNDIWLPGGSRLIKHILIEFDEDVKNSISTLRQANMNEEADKKRSDEAEKLKSKQEEIEAKLDSGEDIDALIKEYSGDAKGSEAYPDGYTVMPKDNVTYMNEFQEAAFVPEKIGDRTTCVTDYGVHIMVYVGDAKVDNNAVKEFTDYLYEQLKQQEYLSKIGEWAAEYAYEIDYEALRLDSPEEDSEESADTSD